MAETETHNLEHPEFAALTAELLEGHDGLRFRARGRSMFPSIKDGDIIVIEKTDASRLRSGDVVMLRTADDSLLVHRVIRTGSPLLTCGDGVVRPDPPCEPDLVIGRVRFVERSGRTRDLDSPGHRMKAGLWAMASVGGRSLFGRALKRVLRLLR
jgi:hypothetical protein